MEQASQAKKFFFIVEIFICKPLMGVVLSVYLVIYQHIH